MRILVDASAVSRGGGGICTYLSGLLSGWNTAGFDDEWVVVGTRNLPPDIDGLVDRRGEVRRIGGDSAGQRMGLQQAYVPAVMRSRSWRPDVLFATTPVIPAIPVPAPVVVCVHDLRYRTHPGEFGPVQRLYRRAAYGHGLRWATRVVAVSEATRRAAGAETAARRHPPRVVHLGADHADRWAGRAPAGHGIAFAHWANKRPEIAIRAWAVVKGRHPGFSACLHVVGTPTQLTGSLRGLAAGLGIAELVRIHPPLPGDEYWELFASASVVLVPSTLEGFGLPVVEAMRLGIPVVATDDAAMREAGGDFALYAGDGSAEAFADHCETVLFDPARRAEIVAGGLDHARCFTWRRTAGATRDVMLEAMAERGDHGRRR